MNDTVALTNETTTGRTFVRYNIAGLDIAASLLYLFIGLFGTTSNGYVVFKFWRVRKTVKVLPFLVCAMVLALNDMIRCLLEVVPYASLILAGRPAPDTLPPGLCKVVGFINNFCDRFAWFNITSIMVFRCLCLIFPLKLRNVSYKPFVMVILLLALFQGCLSILPFLDNIHFISSRYEYNINYGECVYDIKVDATFMLGLIDALWWGPFITCLVSCGIFVIGMSMKSHKAIGGSEHLVEARNNTVKLAVFTIACYIPKQLILFIIFLLEKNYLGGLYEWLDSKYGLYTFLYCYLVFFNMMPAARAAFCPIVLRLPKFIDKCNSNKLTRSSVKSDVTAVVNQLSNLRGRCGQQEKDPKS